MGAGDAGGRVPRVSDGRGLVGAASSHHMRNGMILAFGLFAALVNVFERYHLDGLLFVFILYLIIRGVYLAAFLPSVLRLAEPEQTR